MFESPEARRRALLLALTLVAAIVLSAVVLVRLAPSMTDPTWIRTRLATLGPLAPVAFVALQAVQVVVAPIPGQVLGGVGGYLFGAVAGTALSVAGVALGSAVAFVASRRYGRPYVERVVEPDALARWDGFAARAGVPGLFVLFLLPVFPDDLLCFVAGLTEIRLGTLLILVVVGRTPSFAAAAYAGSRAADGAPLRVGLVLAGLAVASLAVYVARDRIVAALERPG